MPIQSSQSVIATHPHLAYYVFGLLSNYLASPPRAAPVHPLSVSSSGESDGSDEDGQDESGAKDVQTEHQTPKKGRLSGGGDASSIDKEALVRQIVELLDNEEEEQVKDVLKPYMGDLAKVSNFALWILLASPADRQDEILMDQVCLDCMHRRKGESLPDVSQYGS